MFIENLDKNRIRNSKLHTVGRNRDIDSTNHNDQRKNNTIIYSGFILSSAWARQLYCIKCLQQSGYTVRGFVLTDNVQYTICIIQKIQIWTCMPF